ncbi:hypothetical protein B0H15DRAFT_951063 [Mycena belliarum]|uniref:Uncharacterized protein n=1 Tax=Mycena belliarum TaxID=1033014 RepID=A0AAD6XQH3_9AGAR|nr:hypothetical protein B0H15DRAFT_951063 [Mycena belliae]
MAPAPHVHVPCLPDYQGPRNASSSLLRLSPRPSLNDAHGVPVTIPTPSSMWQTTATTLAAPRGALLRHNACSCLPLRVDLGPLDWIQDIELASHGLSFRPVLVPRRSALRQDTCATFALPCPSSSLGVADQIPQLADLDGCLVIATMPDDVRTAPQDTEPRSQLRLAFELRHPSCPPPSLQPEAWKTSTLASRSFRKLSSNAEGAASDLQDLLRSPTRTPIHNVATCPVPLRQCQARRVARRDSACAVSLFQQPRTCMLGLPTELAVAAQLPPFPLLLFLQCELTLSSQPLLPELPSTRMRSPWSTRALKRARRAEFD